MQAQRKRKSSLPPPAPKKRKNASQLEEITFDNTARHEYLTGFHKRKVARIKSAQDEAEKRAKAELIVARKRIRETRKQELQEHVDSVNAMITAIIPGTSKDAHTSSDDEWEGIPNDNDNDNQIPIDHDEEYIDEDKYTTVTVTTMNDDDDNSSEEDENDPKVKARKARESIYNEDGTKKDLRNSGDKKTIKEKKPKVKKKKFRYLSKGERREDQRKQKGIRSKKAYERKGAEGEKDKGKSKEKGKSKGKGKR